jgi:hypothetical protein
MILLLAAAAGNLSIDKVAEGATKTPLPELAVSKFGVLSSAEQKLLEAAANGGEADCKDLSGVDHVICGQILSWICTNPEASAEVTSRGVSVIGAEIKGEVNLEWAKIPFPLRARQCAFDESIILRNSHLRGLYLVGGSIKSLQADGLQIDDNVVLGEGLIARAGVELSSSRICGKLVCDGGQFFSDGRKPALDASDAKIEGSAFAGVARAADTGLPEDVKFKAEGGVDFTDARIGGVFDCGGGEFVRKGKTLALDGHGLRVQGSVFLGRGLKAEGGVDFTRAVIGGEFGL